jgi:hypothetical protein
MKDRIIKNYATTLIGLLLIGASIYAVFTKIATQSEVSGWFATGLVFLRSKDSIIALPK